MHFADSIVALLIESGLIITLLSGLIGLTLEALWPARPMSFRPRLLDLWFAVFGKVIAFAASPLVIAGSSLLLSRLGIGLIPLANAGWALAFSALLYLLTYDLIRYWVHRLEHAVPALWAMHSFHHSATEMNTFTTDRVYWLSEVVQACIITPLLGLLFVATPNVLLIFLVVQVIFRGISHMNVRLDLGKLTLVVMGPQFHRIHHSLDKRHWNKNFAQTFPFFDVLFGTAWKPAPDEWPETGLDEKPRAGPTSAVLWPFESRKAGARQAGADPGGYERGA